MNDPLGLAVRGAAWLVRRLPGLAERWATFEVRGHDPHVILVDARPDPYPVSSEMTSTTAQEGTT